MRMKICLLIFGAASCSIKYSGTKGGLSKLFDDITSAHFKKNWKGKAAMTKATLPTLSDLKMVFTEEGFKRFKMAKFRRDLRRFAGTPKNLARLYRIRATHSDYYINRATTRQLVFGKHNLPGGMTRVARYLRRGLTWYRFKFVRPGKTLGMAYTAFTFIGGRWIFLPKPWHYLR